MLEGVALFTSGPVRLRRDRRDEPQIDVLERRLFDSRLDDLGAGRDQRANDRWHFALRIHERKREAPPSTDATGSIARACARYGCRDAAQPDRCARSGETLSQHRRRVERQQPCVNHTDAIGEPLRFIEVMGSHQYRAALANAVLRGVAARPGDFRIQAGGRLIQQQNVRIVEKRSGQRGFLPHAFR